MDSLSLYAAMRREIANVKTQADRFSAKVAAGTINASDVHDGIRTNGFERWSTVTQVLWDFTDTAVVLTAQDYGFPAEKLDRWGVDPVKLEAAAKPSRAKVIGHWRVDKADAGLNPGTLLSALWTSMRTARDFVAANYPTGVGGEDMGLTIETNGDRVPVVFNSGQMAGLQSLLEDVSAKCATLLP